MIKIKNDVDVLLLKELGFKHYEETNECPEKYEWRNEDKNKFEYVTIYVWNGKISAENVNDKVFELFQMGLVEKV